MELIRYYHALVLLLSTRRCRYLIRVTANGADKSARACRYMLAGKVVAMQNEVPALSAFSDGLATEHYSEMLANTLAPDLLTVAKSYLQYYGTAPFAGVEREIRYWRSGNRAQLDIDGEPACQVNFQKSHIHVFNTQPLDSELNIELITGPALVLLLSQHNIYCLHAGSVLTRAGTIGFIAESGAGKSTLTTDFDEGWQQISDDILPIKFDEPTGVAQILPSYPQLKLRGSVSPNGIVKPKSLDFLVRVNPEPSASIRFKRLPRLNGMLQVVRHTVAAKLFDTELLIEHSNFAKLVSVAVPVIELSYPRKITKLKELRQHIVNYLENPVLQKSASSKD